MPTCPTSFVITSTRSRSSMRTTACLVLPPRLRARTPKELVVKAVGEAGGYGMLIGPHASQEEIASFAVKVPADPRNFIAQPTLYLPPRPPSAKGTYPCHVDLRPRRAARQEDLGLPRAHPPGWPCGGDPWWSTPPRVVVKDTSSSTRRTAMMRKSRNSSAHAESRRRFPRLDRLFWSGRRTSPGSWKSARPWPLIAPPYLPAAPDRRQR